MLFQNTLRQRDIILLPETSACSQTAFKVVYIGAIHSVIVANWNTTLGEATDLKFQAIKLPSTVNTEQKLREYIRNINPMWVQN